MTKLTAQGYELLSPGRYVLEVVEAEPVNEYGPQLRLRLHVAEGEHEGFGFVDYPNRGAEDGVKVSTKAWDIYEACFDRHIAPDEVLDTDELIGRKFEAMVSVKKTGKGNRTEHGTIGPYRPKRYYLKKSQRQRNPTTPTKRISRTCRSSKWLGGECVLVLPASAQGYVDDDNKQA